jgi:hypothetical protein
LDSPPDLVPVDVSEYCFDSNPIDHADPFGNTYINSALAHALLIINEKGLLFLKQPDQEFHTIPCGTARGVQLEHLKDILQVIKLLEVEELH